MLAIYARLSRDDESSQSIENQIDLGISFAKKNDFEFKIYQDKGVSGKAEIEDRPEFVRLMDDIELGFITTVWATRQDRLERNTLVWITTIKLFERYKVKLFFDDKGFFDYTDVDKNFEGNLLSLLNQRLVESSAKASRRQILRNIEKGYVHGTPAFGFKKGEGKLMVVDQDEKKVVEDIYAMSLKGIGTTTIANILNEQGVQTRYNKIGKGTYFHTDQFGVKTVFKKSETIWKANTIRHILKNPLYKGERIWKGEVYEIEAIFSKEYWEKVNDNLPKNKNHKGKKVHHQYLLKGLLKCYRCGRNLNGKRRINKKDNFYYCASKRIENVTCNNRSINIDAIEGVIWSFFFKNGELKNILKSEIEKDDDVVDLIKEGIKNCLGKIKSLEKESTNLIDFIADGGVKNIKVIQNKLNVIDVKIQDEKHKISDYRLQIENSKNSQKILNNYEDEFKKYTNELSFLEKKEIINKYIFQITVNYLGDNKDLIDKSMIEIKNSYYIKVKYNFREEVEEFILNRKENALLSLTNKSIIASNLFVEGFSSEYAELDLKLLFKYSVNVPNVGIFHKPTTLDKDGNILILGDSIIPHGHKTDWNNKSIYAEYKKYPLLFNYETGLGVLSEYKEVEDIITNFKTIIPDIKKYELSKEWIDFLCKAQDISIVT